MVPRMRLDPCVDLFIERLFQFLGILWLANPYYTPLKLVETRGRDKNCILWNSSISE